MNNFSYEIWSGLAIIGIGINVEMGEDNLPISSGELRNEIEHLLYNNFQEDIWKLIAQEIGY